ncbi:MAG: hypothetical protein JJ896_16710 [Rhodothermales bacterium]|nr:hypothetical protein [Rhodothermales bacterium]MBO6781300.1 hypothetical protein [Rhodothermales bacterium]
MKPLPELRLTIVLGLLILAMGHVAEAHGQAFTELDVAGGPVAVVSSGDLASWWTPSPGATVSADTDFYGLRLATGLRFVRWRADRRVPDFDALTAWAGVSRQLVELGPVQARASGRIGNTRMAFDDRSEPGIRNESEFLAGLGLAVTYTVGPRLAVELEWAAERAYTAREVDLHLLHVSVRRSLEMPSWMRDILR